MAPGVGLYLDELFFDGYNLKVDYHDKESARGSSKIANVADTSEGSQTATNPGLNDKDDEDLNAVS